MNSSCFTTHFQTNMKKHTHSFFYSSFIALIELSAAKCSCRFDKFYKTRQKYIEYAIIEAKVCLKRRLVHTLHIYIGEGDSEDGSEGWWCEWFS